MGWLATHHEFYISIKTASRHHRSKVFKTCQAYYLSLCNQIRGRPISFPMLILFWSLGVCCSLLYYNTVEYDEVEIIGIPRTQKYFVIQGILLTEC